MGKQKEEAEETQAVDSDYSGRPLDAVNRIASLGGITIEELRADAARGMRREDRLIMVDADGNQWDALTGEKLPPRKPSPTAARPRRPGASQRS